MKKLLNRLLITLTLLFSSFAFCEPPNLSLARQKVQEYHDSGLYERELTQKIEQAQKYIIEKAVAIAHSKAQPKLALVLDIDETSLSNYDYIAAHNFSANREQFHQEILAAKAPPIKPMLALYQNALAHGIKIFFVTGRRESERKATQTNLLKAGYSQWSGLYLRPDEYTLPSITPFKSGARAKIAQQGYTIIATIGDQYSDINGEHAQKGFKLPNPFYYLP